MTDASDEFILEQFAKNGSEEAFAELVRRHIGLVYSVALRHTNNPEQAQEIAQAVFIILARKAKSLRSKTVLSGWLYNTARLTAANTRRAEFRRIRREQEAFMQSRSSTEDIESAWPELCPLLEDAMARLGNTDRDAVVLRFFENKSLREVGRALGLEERAAQKRVSRGLEKLRAFLAKRGVALPAAVIAGTVSKNSVHAAPAGLAASVATTAAKGVAASATAADLVKQTCHAIKWLKLKFITGITIGVVLMGGIAAEVIPSQTNPNARPTADEICSNTLSAYASLQSYSDDCKIVTERARGKTTTTFSSKLSHPDLYRIDWTSTFGRNTNQGTVWSDGSGNFCAMDASTPQKSTNMTYALVLAAAESRSVLTTIPSFFFKLPGNGFAHANRRNDETLNGLDCYVISSIGTVNFVDGSIGKETYTWWIGKSDLLIRQVQCVIKIGSSGPNSLGADVSTETHENIVANPKFSSSDFAR